MKRGLFIVLIATAMLSGMATAQDKSNRNDKKQQPSAEQMARQKTDRQIKALSLNDDQAEKLYQANLKDIESHNKMRDNKRKFEEQQRADMQKHKDQLRNSAGKILTPEQYAKWEASEKSSQPKHEARQSRHNGYQGKPMGCRGKCGSGKQQHSQQGKHATASKK